MKKLLLVAAAAAVAACAPMRTTEAPTLEDGEMALPANYTAWAKHLSEVQRPDVKQVREIYVNTAGAGVQRGGAYANGTVFVMENWAAKTNTDGSPMTGADGKIVKDKLLRTFVMGKGAGYGAKVPAELKNGGWIYASFDANGMRTADNLSGCRTCHLKFTKTDFVASHERHFAGR